MVRLVTLLLSTVGVADPACVRTADSLIALVERNHPGVHLELSSRDRRTAWRALVDAARTQARATSGDGCIDVLQRVTGWWRDEHLFIWQSPRRDSASLAAARAAVARRPLELPAWRSRWARDGRRDPVEGVWHGDGLQVAVIPAADGDGFEAVVLEADTSTWEPGMVRARIRREPGAGGYRVDLGSRQHRTLRLDAQLIRDDLLRMPPVMWGRIEPVGQEAVRPSGADPRAPALAWLDDTTAVLTVPSFDGRQRATLDTLVRRHAAALQRSARLIIDLRGNEGGGSATALPLLPYIAAVEPGTERPPRIAAWRPWMLATPENERVVMRSVPPGRDTTPAVQALLARLRAAPAGTPVRYVLDDALPRPWRPPVVHARPAEVAILADRHVVSAAEAFILDALRSPRVVLYGEATAGVLDYGNTAIVPIHADERRWYLGYPTVIANDSVPARGIRGRGIVPDVPMDPRAPDVLESIRVRSRGARE